MFHQQVTAVQASHPGIEIVIRWTLGHEGILGNERANEEAKLAAKGESSDKRLLPRGCREDLFQSRSAARQIHAKKTKEKAKKWFEHLPRCQRLQRIDPSMPSSSFRKDTRGLERWKASLLVQLRTRHVPL